MDGKRFGNDTVNRLHVDEVSERKGLREGEETDRRRGAHIRRDKNRIYLQCRSGAAICLSERRS